MQPWEGKQRKKGMEVCDCAAAGNGGNESQGKAHTGCGAGPFVRLPAAGILNTSNLCAFASAASAASRALAEIETKRAVKEKEKTTTSSV